MNPDTRLVHSAWSRFPGFFREMDKQITPERAFDIFKRLADAYAPSLTARYTRGPIIESLIREAPSPEALTYTRNYRRTGNIAVELGQSHPKPIWCLAHLDFISFLTSGQSEGRYALIPYCAPRQAPGAKEAVAFSFDAASGQMEELARGHVVMDKGGDFWFETNHTALPKLTRVMYASSAEWDRDTGIIYGTVDNAFGSAALVLAAQFLSQHPVEALFVFTDEEEGVVGNGNQAFARGSARLFTRTPWNELPDLVVVTDLHASSDETVGSAPDLSTFGHGALFSGVASQARGAVTPPHLLSFQRVLAACLAEHGVLLREEVGYVSRSDCVSAMMVTANVLRVGYEGAYSHFEQTPRAHIQDLVHLAKTLAAWILVAQSSDWRLRYLA